MRVYPFGVYLREFIHKTYAVNRGRNYEFGAGDSDSCIITMSPPPTSSITQNQDKECVDALSRLHFPVVKNVPIDVSAQ